MQVACYIIIFCMCVFDGGDVLNGYLPVELKYPQHLHCGFDASTMVDDEIVMAFQRFFEDDSAHKRKSKKVHF